MILRLILRLLLRLFYFIFGFEDSSRRGAEEQDSSSRSSPEIAGPKERQGLDIVSFIQIGTHSLYLRHKKFNSLDQRGNYNLTGTLAERH